MPCLILYLKINWPHINKLAALEEHNMKKIRISFDWNAEMIPSFSSLSVMLLKQRLYSKT